MNKYLMNKTNYLNLNNIIYQIGFGKTLAKDLAKDSVLTPDSDDKANHNIIIHISGFPGSGKTTLGTKLQKMFGNKIFVYDTDNFIQHHTKEGKKLLSIESEIDNGNKSPSEYKKLWYDTIRTKINEIVEKYQNQPIIFVGSLDNFSWNGQIYEIDTNHRILLHIPIPELLKRYYMRIGLRDLKGDTDDYNSSKYWKSISKGIYKIYSSEQIIADHKAYSEWHLKHQYKFLNENKVINYIKKLINSLKDK